jgi:hypothetical protein
MVRQYKIEKICAVGCKAGSRVLHIKWVNYKIVTIEPFDFIYKQVPELVSEFINVYNGAQMNEADKIYL